VPAPVQQRATPKPRPAPSWGVVSQLLVIAVGALQLSRELLSKDYAEDIAESQKVAERESTAAEAGAGHAAAEAAASEGGEQDQVSSLSAEEIKGAIQQTRLVIQDIDGQVRPRGSACLQAGVKLQRPGRRRLAALKIAAAPQGPGAWEQCLLRSLLSTATCLCDRITPSPAYVSCWDLWPVAATGASEPGC
jgi:hypothetical protein